MKTISNSGILVTIPLLTAVSGLLIFPIEVSQAVRDGLTLCTDVLLPTLFPFFILSSFFVKSGLANQVGRLLDPIMHPLFHLPGCCSAALVLGMVGGYPTGAKTAIELYRNNQCTRREAEALLGFCNNCGPAFLLSAAGIGLFGNLRYGILLMLVHCSAALMTGLLLCHSLPAKSTHSKHNVKNSSISITSAFTDSVTGSFRGMLDLFAFVLCFSAVTCLLQLSGVPTAAGDLLFSTLTAGNGEHLLLGLLEMTYGITHLTGGSIPERLILTSALLGWGGLSVHCQVFSLLQDTPLSPASYLKGKILHAFFSVLLMAGIVFQLHAACFVIGFLPLILPSRVMKKSSGKSAQGIL